MKTLCTTALFILLITLSHIADAQSAPGLTVISRERLKEIETRILSAKVAPEQTGVIRIDPASTRLVHYGPRLYFANGMEVRSVYDTVNGPPGLELMWKSKRSKVNNSIIVSPKGTLEFALIDGLSYHPATDRDLADPVDSDEPPKATLIDERTGDPILTKLTPDIVRRSLLTVSTEVVTSLNRAKAASELAAEQADVSP